MKVGFALQVPLNVHQNRRCVALPVETSASLVHVCPPALLTESELMSRSATITKTRSPVAMPAGGVIGMAPPLSADLITFDDGTKSTLEQQSLDVSAFLMWAAEPKLNDRHQMGFAVMIYLLLLSGLLYASYRAVWKNESH